MVRYWYRSVMYFSNLAFLLLCWPGPRGIGFCLIPIRYTHVVSRQCSIRVQMTWWKMSAISACISQGHIPCLPSTPKTAFRRKSCCVCVCVFRVRESNPSSCSWQKASHMSCQQAEDGAMPMYTVYTIFPGNWKKSWMSCLIPVRRLLAHQRLFCFLFPLICFGRSQSLSSDMNPWEYATFL